MPAHRSLSHVLPPPPPPPGGTPLFLATHRTQKALHLLLHTPPVIPRLSTQITGSMLAPHALALIAPTPDSSCFRVDSVCAVKFKNTAGAVITSHDDMRVEYGVSGGCTRSPVSAAVSSGVVAQTGFVIDGHVGDCGFTFTALFGASTGSIASTNTQPSPISRTVIANDVVFDPALSAAALIAGAPQSFTRAPSPTPSGGPRFSSPHTAHKKRYICFCAPLPSFLV